MSHDISCARWVCLSGSLEAPSPSRRSTHDFISKKIAESLNLIAEKRQATTLSSPRHQSLYRKRIELVFPLWFFIITKSQWKGIMAPQSTPSLPTTLRSPPSVSVYTPLTEHETRTPASFYEGPPVLYYHKVAGRAYLSKGNQDKLPWGSSPSTASSSGDEAWPVMGDDSVEQVVDIFVGSEYV